MKDLEQKEWRAQLEKDENSTVLDVRTDDEVSEGYIPGAKQINISNPNSFMENVNELDKAKNYYVYCRSGGRSSQACQILDQIGVSETYNLVGGFSEWEGEKVSEQ